MLTDCHRSSPLKTSAYFSVKAFRVTVDSTMTYYERWMASVNQNLVEAGAYTLQELGEKMAEVANRGLTYGECNAQEIENMNES